MSIPDGTPVCLYACPASRPSVRRLVPPAERPRESGWDTDDYGCPLGPTDGGATPAYLPPSRWSVWFRGGVVANGVLCHSRTPVGDCGYGRK